MSSPSATMTTSSNMNTAVRGNFVDLEGDDFYEIENYDKMPSFLMSLVSSGDHWMYLSSGGGLTAGRVSAANSLFPYETVDRLHDCHRYSGPFTTIRFREEAGGYSFWQPFVDSVHGPAGQRRLLKHVAGDQVVFEESHAISGLRFRYRWRTSRRYGFIRTVEILNEGTDAIEFDVVDGLQNLLPHGVPLGTYQQASCLVDAYKHNECDTQSGMGIYSLTSQISDRAEAVEALRATTVWKCGLPESTLFLSTGGIDAFLAGETPAVESLCTGKRGNYFAFATLELSPGKSIHWHLIADVARDHQQIARLQNHLASPDSLEATLEQAIQQDHQGLLQNIASSDGLQTTGSQLSTTHHFANVLYNNMRGGVFASNYQVDTQDLHGFLRERNSKVHQAQQAFLRTLPKQIDYSQLVARVREQNDTDLLRLVTEYLPLTFSRRHGDPSRPWNAFEIRVHNDDGSQIYNYQGNWRDIFQNWEALSASFPGFLPSIVAKFVNASTIDGFNPYRITRDGIDWEEPDPEDPWSNIGYWGDHQIVYLTRLLEALRNYYPGELERMLDEQVFCYANVPYRIKSFEELAANSSDTIEFDQFTAQEIENRVETLGADGKLVTDSRGKTYYANLLEKLLVPVLTKISNLVVDGGIWLNTQRPEWNDANNALVGAGLSMVSVCQLRRHLQLLSDLLKGFSDHRFAISVEVEQWYRKIRKVLHENRSLLQSATIDDEARAHMLEATGQAFSDYRLKVYDDGFSGKHTVSGAELVEFLSLGMEYLEHSIRANRREDSLYHAYNLLELDLTNGAASVSSLYEMLEGQVAVLSSGLLDAGQAIELIDAMFESQLYRADQNSFMLYPNRQLPSFLDRNRIEAGWLEPIELLRELIAAGNDSVVVRDVQGDYHFNAAIHQQADLEQRLSQLSGEERWAELVASDRQSVFDVFEMVFAHKSYTGRSGTMYGYEGLGSIYWHMVSKLLLAVQENVFNVADRQASKSEIQALVDAYYLVRGGLSSDKSPSQYGAFPTDPYSHSPSHSGAQQPGMTGQVKEEILTRLGELGVRALDGRLHFQPILLRRREFLETATTFEYFDLSGQTQSLELPAGSLAFTVCQTPVRYRLGDRPLSIEVTYADEKSETIDDSALSQEVSSLVFERSGEIARIDVNIPDEQIVRA
ncbi:hypothetical protein [Adhaeretor mobilis]|uniref:Uncharacterized protein n=1 Tax=Adhaeretor mobilis TaxID=1930276 RepID=A0A517MYE6_9BACT|nr:hypothetical protein [Adhaeretor mobilis]QDS99908.1 hypothetical protein HG15A2_32390 [Adhaeretor mobilis]